LASDAGNLPRLCEFWLGIQYRELSFLVPGTSLAAGAVCHSVEASIEAPSYTASPHLGSCTVAGWHFLHRGESLLQLSRSVEGFWTLYGQRGVERTENIQKLLDKTKRKKSIGEKLRGSFGGQKEEQLGGV